MNRRALLISQIGGMLTLLAGCAGDRDRTTPKKGGDVGTPPVAELVMKSVTDTEIARRATYRIDMEHRATERELAVSVIDEGSKTVTATNSPVPENRPFVYNSSVFELSYNIVQSDSARKFRITLSNVSSEKAGNTIKYSDLPEIDKTKLAQYGWEDGGPFESAGVPIMYSEDGLSNSVLVPDFEYEVIKWDSETRARITIEHSGDTKVKTYRYTARQLHESAQEFGKTIRENHVIPLSALSKKQKTIISKAIGSENGYEITEGEPPKAFEQLVDRFSQGDEIPSIYSETQTEATASGSYIVRYEDEVYWAKLLV